MGVPALAGLALAAAGTGMQVAAANQERGDMNAAAQNELNRQQGFKKQAGQQFAQSLYQTSQPQVAKQFQQGQAKTQDAMARTQAFPLSLSSATASLPNAATTEDAGTRAFNERSNVANAALGSYDEFNLQQAIKNLRAQQQLGLIGTQAAASQQVLPLELQAASQNAAGLQGAGSLLGTVGSLASMYGAIQGGQAAKAAYNPYGVQNWAGLTPALQQQYGQAYQYYAPGGAGYSQLTAPYTNPYQ